MNKSNSRTPITDLSRSKEEVIPDIFYIAPKLVEFRHPTNLSSNVWCTGFDIHSKLFADENLDLLLFNIHLTSSS